MLKKILILFIVFTCTACTETEQKDIKQETKTYKVCSDKYINYVYKAGELAFEGSTVFNHLNSTTHYPYLVIRYYSDKQVSDKDFDDEVERIYKNFSNEIYKYKYTKKKCGMKYTYEYINLEFYNKKGNQSIYQTYKQFNVA